MNITQEDIKFLQYDAKVTKELRKLWKSKNPLFTFYQNRSINLTRVRSQYATPLINCQ